MGKNLVMFYVEASNKLGYWRSLYYVLFSIFSSDLEEVMEFTRACRKHQTGETS